MLRAILAALFICVASPSFAQVGLDSFFQGPWNQNVSQGHYRSHRSVGRNYSATVVGGRPAGCPSRYCGCASARYVGLRGGQWNLAANWLRLPRAAPAPGMAAARRGHVKIITAVHGGGRYSFYDPNSGGGRTRVTTGSLAGYAVVNPMGGYSQQHVSAARKVRHWHRRWHRR